MKKKAEFRVIEVPFDSVKPSPSNPRKTFDTEKIHNLAGSIGELGEMEEISVRILSVKEDEPVEYEIINGERRYRAEKELRTKTLRVKAYNIDAIDAGVLRLNEGEPLDQLEKENAIAELFEAGLEAGKWKTQAEFARKIQLDEKIVSRIIRSVKERKLTVSFSNVPTPILDKTRSLEPSVREVVIEQYKSGEISKTGIDFQNTIRDIKAAPEDLQIEIAKREISVEDAKTTEALETIAPEARRELLALRKSDSITSKELSARVEALKEAPEDIRELIVTGKLAPDTALKIAKLPTEEKRAKFVKEAELVKTVQEREVAAHLKEIDRAADNERKGKPPEPTAQDIDRDIARVEQDDWITGTLYKLHTETLAAVRTDFIRDVSDYKKREQCLWYIQDIAEICQKVHAESRLVVERIVGEI